MPSSNRLNSSNRLKLGIFSSNCSSGMAVTKVEERWGKLLGKQSQFGQNVRCCWYRVYAANCPMDRLWRRDRFPWWRTRTDNLGRGD